MRFQPDAFRAFAKNAEMLRHAAFKQQGMRVQQKVKGLLPLQPAHSENDRGGKTGPQ